MIRNIFKKSNIGTIIFFLLNATIIIGLFALGGVSSLLIGAALYMLSILLAFSGFGDWVLCVMAGAKKMTRTDMKIRMRPLLEIVYKKAMKKTPGLSNQLRLKVIYTPEPNAYAIGRRTICVTEGLFELPDDVVQGVLAHEVVHLALKHTHIQLLIGGGNFIITIFILIMRLIYSFLGIVTVGSILRSGSQGCLSTLPSLFIAGIIWLWTKFCMLFLMWSSRKNEFDADTYAAELGYGYELAKALDAIGTSEPQESLFKALFSTHPNTHERIARLQNMGVQYYRY
ncbi:MAG: M48 family metalloprotease [Oscillospiraceae bacterium]|nr:M48 family metalloprotease [Oscillospiraceae bacterium]